jgi:hypothetical protein
MDAVRASGAGVMQIIDHSQRVMTLSRQWQGKRDAINTSVSGSESAIATGKPECIRWHGK